MREGWRADDSRFVLFCVAVAVVCGLEAWRDFGRAFPEASIDFQVNRSTSRPVAEAYLGRLGFEVEAWKHAAIFRYDNTAKIFLERELGPEQAQARGEELELWRWSHRWFRPEEKEELQVEVTPRGEIAHFEHLLPEEAPGDSLSEAQARQLAEEFLAAHTDVALERHDFVEAASVRRPARVDHTFTWKRTDFAVGGSTARVRVQVAGSAVTAYEEFLQVPDQWLHDYRQLRSRNETANLVAAVLGFVTGLAMLLVLVFRIRDRDVRWRTAAAIAVLAFVLQLLAALNELGLARYEYPTEQGYFAFMTWQVVVAVLGASAAAGVVLLLTAAAEPVYRQSYPHKLSLGRTFTWRGLGTRDAFRQIMLGVTLAFFFVAYQTVFYLVAARYGAWAPLDVPYDNMLNTVFPWAVVLFSGFFPAVSEEFVSRLFSVPFLSGLLQRGRRWRRPAVALAVVISSCIWGFAHAGYPNQPFYIRGLEVSVAGIVTSWVMLRWGILATLVWHYSVDACYTALLMVRSGDTYLVLSGAAAAGIMLVPLGIAVGRILRQKGFEPTDGLRNGDEPGPQTVPAAVAEPEPEAVQAVRVPRSRLAVGAGVAAALLFLYAVPVERPGEGLKLLQGRGSARQTAVTAARAIGIDPDSFHVAMAVRSRYDDETGKYVLEQAGIPALNTLYRDPLCTPVWFVRFYRPGDLEEASFDVPAAAAAQKLGGFEHVVPETAAGVTLPGAEARALAEDFLRAQGFQIEDLTLVEESVTERPARRDHHFEWENRRFAQGEGVPRLAVTVQGERVGRLHRYLHVPEEWLRAQRERGLMQRLAWVLGRALLGSGILMVTLLFVGQVRSRRFPWRRALRWGSLAGALALLGFVLEWEARVATSYPSSTPWALFRVLAVSVAGVRVLVLGMLAAMLIGTLLAVRPETRALLSGRSGTSRRDAVLLTLIGVATLCGLRQAAAVVQAAGSAHLRVGDLFSLDAAASPLPWLDGACTLFLQGMLALSLFGLLAHLAQRAIGPTRFLLVLVAGVLLFAGGNATDVLEWGMSALLLTLRVGGLLWLTCFLYRGHDLAYLLTYLAGLGGLTVFEWLQQPEGGLRISAGLLGLLVAAVILWFVRRSPRRAA